MCYLVLCAEYIHAESVTWEQPFILRLIYSLILILGFKEPKHVMLLGFYLEGFSFCSSPLSVPTSSLSELSNLTAPEAGEEVDRPEFE